MVGNGCPGHVSAYDALKADFRSLQSRCKALEAERDQLKCLLDRSARTTKQISEEADKAEAERDQVKRELEAAKAELATAREELRLARAWKHEYWDSNNTAVAESVKAAQRYEAENTALAAQVGEMREALGAALPWLTENPCSGECSECDGDKCKVVYNAINSALSTPPTVAEQRVRAAFLVVDAAKESHRCWDCRIGGARKCLESKGYALHTCGLLQTRVDEYDAAYAAAKGGGER